MCVHLCVSVCVSIKVYLHLKSKSLYSTFPISLAIKWFFNCQQKNEHEISFCGNENDDNEFPVLKDLLR